jgi:hypothetical protein
MTRRKIIIGASVVLGALGLVAFAGIADRFGILGADEDDDDDDEGGQAAVVRGLRFAKVSLQQGLNASEWQGQPISGKFEVDRGNFQLSVYTAKEGRFSEVLVDYSTGEISKVTQITAGDSLAAAQSQGAAMARAKNSLKDVVEKSLADAAGFRAVGVVPNLKDGRAAATVLLVKGEDFKLVNQPLE